MTDAYREASKYETARKRELKRHHAAKDRERENHQERMNALRAALSPAAARIVVAAEGNPFHEAAPSGFVGQGVVEMLKDEGAIPANLLNPPEPIPPGGVIEVEHKPKARRA